MPLRVLSGLLIAALSLLNQPTMAQAVHSTCHPNPGASRECALKFPEPYRFMLFTCGSNVYHPNEAAARAAFLAPFANYSCIDAVVPRPWLQPGAETWLGTELRIFFLTARMTPAR
jgi:hypothetical protein